MKIVILTTQTTHHTYFVQKISEKYRIEAVVLETESNAAPFLTHHDFEDKRNDYEKDVFFSGQDVKISDIVKAEEFCNVNMPECISFIKSIQTV